MKNITFTFSLIFFIFFQSNLIAQFQSQWTNVSPNYQVNNDPFGLGFYVVDENIAWSIPLWLNGQINPKISKTTDGGANWSIYSPDLQASDLVPTIVYALDETRAWIGTQQMPSGNYGSVMKTTDGGNSWSTLDIPYVEDQIPYAIHFYNDMEGIVVAQDFFTSTNHVDIYKTVDGGLSWQVVSPSGLLPAEIMWLWSGEHIMERIGDHLWMGTGKGRAMHSTDRGETWSIVELGFSSTRGVNSVAFMNEQTGVALTSYDLDILNNSAWIDESRTLAVKTTDGGASWNPINIPPLLEHIEYVPNSGGVFIGASGYTGYNQHFISKDMGETWKEYSSPGMININFTSPESGFATVLGFAYGIFKYEGEPLLFDESPLSAPKWVGQADQLTPAFHTINDVHIIDTDMVWGLTSPFLSQIPNSNPSVVRTIDGGDNWEELPITIAQGRRTFDIHAMDDETAFVTSNNLGSSKELLKTSDGGNSWNVVNSNDACGGYVHFFNSQEGLVINDDLIEITNDGGISWTVPDLNIPNLSNGDIFDKNFAVENTTEARGDSFWYLTRNNKIIRTNDKGETWEVFNTPERFWSIAMRDSLNGLAVAIEYDIYIHRSHIYKTADGGETWEIAAIMDGDFTAFMLEYIEGSEAYMGSNYGNSATCFTIDDGATWELIEGAPSTGISKFLDPETGWVVGTRRYTGFSPLIYKWDGEAFPQLIVGIEESVSLMNIQVFPNPIKDYITINLNDLNRGKTTIDLLDVNGQLIRSTLTNENIYTFKNLADLPSGNYFIRVIIDKKLRTLKVIKQ